MEIETAAGSMPDSAASRRLRLALQGVLGLVQLADSSRDPRGELIDNHRFAEALHALREAAGLPQLSDGEVAALFAAWAAGRASGGELGFVEPTEVGSLPRQWTAGEFIERAEGVRALSSPLAGVVRRVDGALVEVELFHAVMLRAACGSWVYVAAGSRPWVSAAELGPNPEGAPGAECPPCHG